MKDQERKNENHPEFTSHLGLCFRLKMLHFTYIPHSNTHTHTHTHTCSHKNVSLACNNFPSTFFPSAFVRSTFGISWGFFAALFFSLSYGFGSDCECVRLRMCGWVGFTWLFCDQVPIPELLVLQTLSPFYSQYTFGVRIDSWSIHKITQPMTKMRKKFSIENIILKCFLLESVEFFTRFFWATLSRSPFATICFACRNLFVL